MKKKIIGIFVMTLLIATAIHAMGLIEENKKFNTSLFGMEEIVLINNFENALWWPGASIQSASAALNIFAFIAALLSYEIQVAKMCLRVLIVNSAHLMTKHFGHQDTKTQR